MKMNKKRVAIKTVKIGFNVLFYVLLVLLVLFSIANTKIKESNKDIAHVFNRGFLSVLTSSMDGDQKDSFSTEDLIFVKLLNEEQKQELKEGDIITYFKSRISGLNRPGLITHRIYAVTEDSEGDVVYITLGDASPEIPDPNSEAYIDFSDTYFDAIHYDDVISVYTGQIKNAGNVIKSMQTANGFGLYVVLPVVLILMVEGILLTKNILALNKEKLTTKYEIEKQDAVKNLELEKEKMRQQIIEELKKEQK
jgi:signal peptidase I